MVRAKYRGHWMRYNELRSLWCYEDTGEPVPNNPDRPCGKCGLSNTPEGHDGCLGTLPGVMNACCGHGITADAYVMFHEGDVPMREKSVDVTIRGAKAIKIISALKRRATQ